MRLAILLLMLAASSNAQSVQPTRIGQHHLGETLQDWITITHVLDDMNRVCNSQKRGREGKWDKSRCEDLQRVRDGKQSKFESGDATRNVNWEFLDGKLSSVHITIPGFGREWTYPDIQQEIAFLVDRYGKPEVRPIAYQNSYGARWECSEYSWSMPDGSIILATEGIRSTTYNGPKRDLSILFLSKEYLDRKSQQTPSNPYK